MPALPDQSTESPTNSDQLRELSDGNLVLAIGRATEEWHKGSQENANANRYPLLFECWRRYSAAEAFKAQLREPPRKVAGRKQSTIH